MEDTIDQTIKHSKKYELGKRSFQNLHLTIGAVGVGRVLVMVVVVVVVMMMVVGNISWAIVKTRYLPQLLLRFCQQIELTSNLQVFLSKLK